MATAEAIALCNKACLAAGVNKITTFSDGTAESDFCDQWYEAIVKAELSLYKWRFATTTFDLTPNLLVDAPDTAWNTAYQAPTGIMSVDTVLVGEVPIKYDRHQDEIHTNDTGEDTVILKYRYRADETLWNPYFELLIVYRLAAMLSFSLARRADVGAEMEDQADKLWRKAKTEDAQAQTNQKVNLRRMVRARGGSLDKFWRRR